MVEGVHQGPILVGTFFMVTLGTWALMSPAQGRPGCRSSSPWS